MALKKLIEKKKKVDHNKYNSQIAQVIESGGNVLNNISNPWFVLALILLIGGGYVLYKATYVISNSIEHLTSKIENLSSTLSKQELQNFQQIEILKDILNNQFPKK